MIRQMDRLLFFQGRVGNTAQHRSLCELVPLPSTLRKALPRDRCHSNRSQMLCSHLCLQSTCFVEFCRMRSQPAIHGFRSRFHEPKTSKLHAEMLLHGQIHPNSLDSSPWPTFELHRLLSRSMVLRANPTHPENCAHALRYFLHISLATIP